MMTSHSYDAVAAQTKRVRIVCEIPEPVTGTAIAQPLGELEAGQAIQDKLDRESDAEAQDRARHTEEPTSNDHKLIRTQLRSGRRIPWETLCT